MAPSGVKVSDDAFNCFISMKMKKKHRFMFMIIEDGFIVQKEMVEKSDDQIKDFEEFLNKLPKNSSCYVVLDLTVPSQAGSSGNKEQLYYISWCPDTAGIQDKMLYAATKQAFLDKIKEGTKNVQANDLTDLIYEELLKM